MAYTNDKQLPKIRREAAKLVRDGWSTRKVARHFGYSQSVIVKWSAKAREIGDHPIPTKSSRPKSHPNTLKKAVVQRIVALRLKTQRTSEVVHQHLLNEGVHVSLNSVRRTIDRHGLMKKKSVWKRYHPPTARPVVAQPGDLIETDTIHRMISKKKRLYVFTLIDVYSRWAYAKAYASMSSAPSSKKHNGMRRCASESYKAIMDQSSVHGLCLVLALPIVIRDWANPTTMRTSNGSTEPFRKNVWTSTQTMC